MVVRVNGGIITDQMLTGSIRYFEIDGGSANDEFENTIADGNQRAQQARPIAGGTGYSVSDVLTLAGATGTASTFTVNKVGTAGEVLGVSITTAGDMSAVPANPASVTGGGGSNATIEVDYSSTIIVPGASGATATGTQIYVPVDGPVPSSAAEQTLEVVAQRANIVQIAIVSDAVIQVACENTSFGWEVTNDDLRDAIRALGASVAVPDDTAGGTTVDLTGATVTEKFFSAGIA